MALGNDVWIDTSAIRPGEEWREAIKKAIREADVFQLFWSRHSASSKEVRKEWEYALETRCADGNCHGFIRPVYWEDEMPECPPELGHLNFKYVQYLKNNLG